MHDHTDPLATMTSPDVSKLLQELERCTPIENTSEGISAVDDVRFCRWPSQHRDGKKHDAPEKAAFPWDGASDGQPMLADAIINERASLLVTAFWRSAVKAKSSDDEASQYAVRLIEHYLNESLFHELYQEVALAANHVEHYGVVVLNPCWERRVAMRRVRVTLPELNAIAQQLGQSTPESRAGELLAFIADPTQEDNAVAVLQFVYAQYTQQQTAGAGVEITVPTVREGTFRKAVRKLRETGVAEVPVPYLCRNAPAIYALKVWDEVWVPNDTTDLRSARVIFHREWMTEAALRAKELEGWDPKWIEEAIKTKGMSIDVTGLTAERGGGLSAAATRAGGDALSSINELIEVLHATYKAVDDDGVTGVYQTTLSKHVPQPKGGEAKSCFAKTELISYAHGEYPYIGGKAEHWTRQFLASRGVPEMVRTWQQQVKAMDDSVTDYLSIGVLPPVNVPYSPLKTKYKFGPAVQNPVKPGSEPQFMQVPQSGVPYALSARAALEARVNNYFGLMSADVPPPRWQQMQAIKATFFLLLWSEALQQMVALAQQYMADAEFARITGAPVGWLDQRRDRIGTLAITLSFDVRDLDPELTMQRIRAMNEVVLPADVMGVVDRTKWVEMLVRAVDPTWARQLLMPAAAASEQLWRQVRDEIAQMALGNEARYVENDPTAPTKLQYTQQIVQANPQYQAQLAQGGRFTELMKKYAANLQFSAQQSQNKQIGRIGVQPEAPQ